MGLIMSFLKKRYGDKLWIYAIDWAIELAMAGAFIYMSWTIGQLAQEKIDYSKCLLWENSTVNCSRGDTKCWSTVVPTNITIS
jgi:hypothetical protein